MDRLGMHEYSDIIESFESEGFRNIIEKVSLEMLRSGLALSETVHMSTEVLFAYADDNLSEDAASKVDLHLQECSECPKILRILKESDQIFEEAVSSNVSSRLPGAVPKEIELKADFVVILNNKEDELAEHAVKVLLPEVPSNSVLATITVVRNQDEYHSPDAEDAPGQLRDNAFSTPPPEDEYNNYELISEVVYFVELVKEMLIERCDSREDIKDELPDCIDDAVVMTGCLEFDSQFKRDIACVFTQLLSRNEESG